MQRFLCLLGMVLVLNGPSLAQVTEKVSDSLLLPDSVITEESQAVESIGIEIPDTTDLINVPDEENFTEESVANQLYERQIRAQQLNEEGEGFMRHQEWSPAARRFREAIELNANLIIARQNLGLASLELGEWGEAIRQLSLVLEDSANAEAHFGRARAFIALQKDTEAFPDLDATLGLNPDHVEAWYEKGVLTFLQALYPEALVAFKRATTLDPNHALAWHDQGSALRATGNLEEALVCYQKAVQLAPVNYIFFGSLGSLQKEMMQFEAAMGSFNEAIRLHPTDGRIWNHRGVLLNEMGDYANAELDFSKAIQLQAGMAIVWNNRGNARFKSNRYNEAIADYSEAIRLDPTYAAAFLNRGIAREMLRDEEGACNDWKKAASLGMKGAKIYFDNQCKNILKEIK